MKSRKPIGQLLLEGGLITSEQLEQALVERKSGEFLGEALVRLGFLPETQLIPILAEQLHVPAVSLKAQAVDPEAVRKVSARLATRYHCVPLTLTNGTLHLAMADPFNVGALDELRLLLKCELKPFLAGSREIEEAIQRYYGVGASTIETIAAEAIPEYRLPTTAAPVEELEVPHDEASLAQFVNQLLLRAYHERATDVHIEPFEHDLRVRFRVDGFLRNVAVPANLHQFQAGVISRIKIMAQLNIAERRLPQDGRVKVRVGQDELDLRVSIVPTPYGESAMLRILTASLLYSLEQLGLASKDLLLLQELIQRPHGILFVTGPTGSGKTTSLYACLHHINTTDRKIVTIEDPIEYQLNGITQIQVHPKIGLTFAHGLRSVLRHDPDVLMVGEVRDSETAEITIRCALTGHLVFSTLHTNDAAGGVARLLDMSIEPFLVASSVECFIAQRLVRVLCERCKAPMPRTSEHLGLVRAVGLADADVERLAISKGCEACQGTGFHGRTAIYEFLVVDEPIRERIMRRAPSTELAHLAMERGMRTLRQDGREKILRGLTTPAEVLRVSANDDRAAVV